MKRITISFLFILSLCQISFAQQNNLSPVNYYIWGNATYNSIGGDFDGKGTYSAEGHGYEHTIILPDFKPAVGWEIGFGVSKSNHSLNIALGYTKFNNATFEDYSDLRWIDEIKDAYLGYYEANYGYRFLNKKRLNLSGLIGFGLNTKSANETYEASFATGITKYEDININFGINMKYNVTKRIFLNTTVMYKLSNHSSVEISSASIDEYKISGLNGNWLSINVGIGVKLGKTEAL